MLQLSSSAGPSPIVRAFDSMVCAIEKETRVQLPHHMHLFLVGCLAFHYDDADLFGRTVTFAYATASEKPGMCGVADMRNTGDEALLVSGLHPECFEHRGISPAFYQAMGQAAYNELAVRHIVGGKREPGRYYNNASRDFPLLVRTLRHASIQREEQWNWELAWEKFQIVKERLLH